MKDIIEILQKMGAHNVEHIVAKGDDDQLCFTYGGQKVTLYGIHCNDGTAALSGFVEPLPQVSINK